MIQHWYISIASSVYLESVFLCPEMAKIETLRCSDVLWTVYFSLQSVTDSRQNKDKKKNKNEGIMLLFMVECHSHFMPYKMSLMSLFFEDISCHWSLSGFQMFLGVVERGHWHEMG